LLLGKRKSEFFVLGFVFCWKGMKSSKPIVKEIWKQQKTTPEKSILPPPFSRCLLFGHHEVNRQRPAQQHYSGEEGNGKVTQLGISNRKLMIQSSLVAAGRTAQQARHVLQSRLKCVRVPSSVHHNENMISSSGGARLSTTATCETARGHGNKGFAASSSVVMKNRSLLFSTDSSSTSSGTLHNVEVSSHQDMPTSELLLAASQCTSEGDAFQAHQILELLQSHKDVSEADVTKIATSLMTAWIENQSQCLTALEESIFKHQGNHKVLLGHLEGICDAAEYATQLLEKYLLKGGSVFKPSSSQEHHLVAVLDAWAKASEAGRNANLPQSLTSNVTKGIPQRMQHLLQQPKLKSSNAATMATATPTTTYSTDVYNQILRAWACSDEHLRGSMAEQIFQTIEVPNGESFRWIILAWCWSKERRRAFTATGHYMRRIRLLELGQTDMEPTMEDYHALFEAWTKAE
jgi:hypothetical protein